MAKKSRKKKVEQPVASVAVSLFESFMDKYAHLKQTEKKVKVLTNTLKARLEKSEQKRHEFPKYGMVGRFIAKNIYETDFRGLNEYLYDVGLLFHVVEMDNRILSQPENIIYKELLQEFRLEDTFFVKPSFNKLGKALNDIPSFAVDDSWNNEDIVRSIAIMKPQIKNLNREYEALKRRIARLPEIQELGKLPKEERPPLKHQFGSLSVINHQPKYDIPRIYECYGERFLIEFGVPNGKVLEDFILNGTISKKEIDQFKTIKDIRLEFTVMSLEDEEKLLSMLDEKQRIAAANRM